MSTTSKTTSQKSYAWRVVPARAEEPVSLSTAMQSLILSERTPMALEIAGTPHQRAFILRATSEAALTHLAAQLRARYPQVDMQPLPPQDDPWCLRAGETLSVVELRLGASPYLPLQQWNERQINQKGHDPLLGILAALDGIPPALRVVAQLALVPASPIWSKGYQRKALEHALEPERQRQQQRRHGGGTLLSFPLLCSGMLALVLLLFQQHRLPAWMELPLGQLLQGKLPHLALGQQLALAVLAGLPLVIVLVLRLLGNRLLARSHLYDMKLVEQQTSRMAYHVRLRLYVIGPGTPWTGHGRGQVVAQTIMHAGKNLGSIVQRAWNARASYVPALGVAFHVIRSFLGTRCHEVAVSRMQVVRRSSAVPNWQRPLVWLSILVETLRFWSNRLRTWRIAVWKRVDEHPDPWRQARRRSQDRHALLERLIAAYRQFHLATGNYFVPRALSTKQALRLLRPQRQWWQWRCGWWQGVRRSPCLLSVEALSQLWHLPQAADLPELALVERRLSRTFLIPPHLAWLAKAQPGNIMGISEHAGHALPFALPRECLDQHLLLLGKSGEGKSTCMAHLAVAAMQQGGLVVIDPHGDLVDQLLPLVPVARLEDVVVIDLADMEYAVGLNPLDVTLGRGRDKAITDLLTTFSHIWDASWGSRMENSFTYALRTLYEANTYLVEREGPVGIARQYTLLDVIPILTDESFCHALLECVQDDFIRRWWATYYDPLSLSMQRDRSDPVLSKVARFESLAARRIVGQSQSTLNFVECIEQEKLIFFKLAKGVVGEDVAGLLGALFMGLLQLTFAEQGRVTTALRKRLPVMIDEFQVLKGVDWSLLAEIRKYGAAFYLATQSLDYLREADTQLLPTVLSNVKQHVVFHASALDAYTIHRELGVEPEDIINLERYQCYVKLTYQQRRQPTFSLSVQRPPAGDATLAQHLYERCHQQYMRPVGAVDQAIKEALARALAACLPNTQGEQGKYRGRKGQERRAKRSRETDVASPAATTAEPITTANASASLPNPVTMQWQETVGHPGAPEEEEEAHERNA